MLQAAGCIVVDSVASARKVSRRSCCARLVEEAEEEEGPKTRPQARSKRLRNLWNSVDNGDSQ